jgi:uncharacterized protein (DUF2235 family)
MNKNIVICSDGTGNTTIKGRGTNVFKMFESIDVNGHRFDSALDPQVSIYDDGVGTEDLKPLKILGGVTGWGLSRNVKQLYKELCRIYDPGDKIFLFGFSRGAFTVRTLAGIITRCGIIDARKQSTASAFDSCVNAAYKAYRSCYRTIVMSLIFGEPGSDATVDFKAKFCHRHLPEIHFIGVWDTTVDAVGLPFHISDMINTVIYRFKFPNHRLSEHVKHAYHALAIDDERHSFHPLLWDQSIPSENQKIEQVWFAGAHSNVGGGYPKQGMSLVALDWLMEKAKSADLRFIPDEREYYRDHANVDDKLYDPRAGLGVFYRWKPRDIAAICRKNSIVPAIHLSVLERVAHGTEDYSPGTLPSNAAVVITPTGDPEKDATAQRRALATENLLKSAHRNEQSLLDRVPNTIGIGRFSYYIYLLSCVATLIVASGSLDKTAGLNLWTMLKDVFLLVINISTSPFSTLPSIYANLSYNAVRLVGIFGGFVLAYILMKFADRRMTAIFSRFWFEQQQRLRDALKQAREKAKQAVLSRAETAKTKEQVL